MMNLWTSFYVSSLNLTGRVLFTKKTKQAKESYIDTEKLFNSSDTEGSEDESYWDGDLLVEQD